MISGVESRCWILALFIRSDGQRLLLGDGAYDFKESQQHFQANTYDNDTVEVQGSDGILLAGQVRRPTKQNFDGYIGDATMTKAQIEQYRRNFFTFFRKNYFYEVVYIFPNGDTIMRQRGFIVDAPEVEELWQIHPEYHVALNFEDVNYYAYAEDADGNVIYSGSAVVPITGATAGGLVWDEIGAVTEESILYASGTVFTIDNKLEANIDIKAFEMYGETSQDGTPSPSSEVAIKTVSGNNTITITGIDVSTQLIALDGKNLYGARNGARMLENVSLNGTTGALATASGFVCYTCFCEPDTTYAISRTTSTSRFVIGCMSDVPATGKTATLLETNNGTGIMQKIVTTSADANYLVIMLRSNSDTATAQEIAGYIQVEKTEFPVESLLTIAPQTNAGITATLEEDGGLSYSGTATASYANISTSTPIELPAGTYTFMVKEPMESVSLRLRLQDSSGTSLGDQTIGAGQSSVVFTTTQDAAQAYLWLGNVSAGTSYNATIYPKLIAGTLATSYEAYWGGELNKLGDYQDYIYKSGDDWYVHKETDSYEFTGTEAWFRSSNTSLTQFVAALELLNATPVRIPFDAKDDSLTNYFKLTTTASSLSVTTGLFLLVNNVGSNAQHIRISFDISEVENLAAATEWLQANKLSIYYPSSVTSDVKLTNTDLISQLDGVLNLTLNSGENEITTATDGAVPTLKMGYEGIGGGGGGFVWEAGEGIIGDITVNSVDNVFPVWTVTGETVNPTLENVTTGTLIQYNGTITDQQTLIIDMTNQTATLNGVNVIGNVVGDWLMFAPNRNRVVYTADNQNAPASKIEWNDIVG